jgi:broad specificity phosphatase PhoE
VAPPTVALVRHAPTAWSGRWYCGRTDVPLHREGVRVAAQVADGLLGSLDAGGRIVTSPLARATATASAIETVTGASVEIDERWREIDFGEAEGRSFEDVARRWPRLAARLVAGDLDVDWPDGESATTFRERVLAAWADLAGDDRPTVVVAHGGPIRLVLARLLDRSPAALVRPPEPGGIVWVPGPGGLVPATDPAPTTAIQSDAVH